MTYKFVLNLIFINDFHATMFSNIRRIFSIINLKYLYQDTEKNFNFEPHRILLLKLKIEM